MEMGLLKEIKFVKDSIVEERTVTTALVWVSRFDGDIEQVGIAWGKGENRGLNEAVSKARRMAGLTQKQAQELADNGEIEIDHERGTISVELMKGKIGKAEGWKEYD